MCGVVEIEEMAVVIVGIGGGGGCASRYDDGKMVVTIAIVVDRWRWQRRQ